MTTIKEYFKDNQNIGYDLIISYISLLYLEEDSGIYFTVREITSDSSWQVEAIAPITIQGVVFLIVFNEDILSPYKNYTQSEVEKIISELKAHYNNTLRLLKI